MRGAIDEAMADFMLYCGKPEYQGATLIASPGARDIVAAYGLPPSVDRAAGESTADVVIAHRASELLWHSPDRASFERAWNRYRDVQVGDPRSMAHDTHVSSSMLSDETLLERCDITTHHAALDLKGAASRLESLLRDHGAPVPYPTYRGRGVDYLLDVKRFIVASQSPARTARRSALDAHFEGRHDAFAAYASALGIA